MPSTRQVTEWMTTFRREHGRKVAKYFVGSVIATIVSTLTFVLTFGPGLLGARSASLASSGTGAIANYFLNRNWTWERRGRAGFRSEMLPYWTVVIVTAVVAALFTGVVNDLVRHVTDNRATRTLVNTAAYVTVYGVSFIVKYVFFDRLFTRRARAEGAAPLAEATAQATTPPLHQEREAVS